LHNRVHVWVGGSMIPMTSPDDPVFFLHHCNIDRIWAQWQQKYPASSYLGTTGYSLTDLMWPWNAAGPLCAPVHVLNCGLLEYQYDTVKATTHYPTVLPIGPLTYREEGVAGQGQIKIEPIPPYFLPPRVMPPDPVPAIPVVVHVGSSANADPIPGWLDYKYGLFQAREIKGFTTTIYQGEFTDHTHGKGTIITTRSDDKSVKVNNWVAGD
jgi:tyrosinase-like protein